MPLFFIFFLMQDRLIMKKPGNKKRKGMVLSSIGYMNNADFEGGKVVNDNIVQDVFIICQTLRLVQVIEKLPSSYSQTFKVIDQSVQCPLVMTFLVFRIHFSPEGSNPIVLNPFMTDVQTIFIPSSISYLSIYTSVY